MYWLHGLQDSSPHGNILESLAWITGCHWVCAEHNAGYEDYYDGPWNDRTTSGTGCSACAILKSGNFHLTFIHLMWRDWKYLHGNHCQYRWFCLSMNSYFSMDSSIRLRRPLVDVLFPDMQKFPIRVNSNEMFDGAFTREETYQYLGVTRKQVSKRFQKEGGLNMWRNCSFLYEHVLSALVDCALHEECIAPSGSSPYGCNFAKYEEQSSRLMP